MSIGIYITVRLSSTRLEKKAIRKVLDKPIIGYLIDRVKKKCDNLAQIIICTSTNPIDDILDEVAEQYGIDCYHGIEGNVIQRHYDCANHFGHQFIVNVDGDDILCNPDYIKMNIESYIKNKSYDVIKSEGLPFGTNSCSYSIKTLESVLDTIKNTGNVDTGWGEFIKDARGLNILTLNAKNAEKLDVRMTLDYEDDFVFFERVITDLRMDIKYVEQDEIISYIRKYPDIIKINEHLNEIYWENYNRGKNQ